MSQYRLETEEDMLGYLDINYGHGVSAVYTNSSGATSTINIIINNEYVEQLDGTGAFGNTLNVSAIKDVDGNTLKAAQNYTIVNIQSDRTGFSALMLEEI